MYINYTNLLIKRKRILIFAVSPVILEPVPLKMFPGDGTLHWLPMTNGQLPPDAMIGGFENEFTYIARAYHNGSICPGRYIPSTGKAFVPWGGRAHKKWEFEILCGFNAVWVKTRSNIIPPNAFIGGRSEVRNEPLYIGRAMIDQNLISGKVHTLYHLCFLPYNRREVEVVSYEILVIPENEIPQALPFTY